MTDQQREILESHKEQIAKYNEKNEEVRFNENPDFIKEAERCLTIICKNFKGFLVGLYRSPKIQKVVFIVLIALVVADNFQIYPVSAEYQKQVNQGISDWQGWEQRAKEPEREQFSNRFLIIGNEHTHEELKIENLNAGTVVSSISGSYNPVFEHYRNV